MSRTPGMGSVELRAGRFRARMRVGGRRLDLGTYPTEAEAEGVLQAMRDQVASGELVPSGAITLRDFGRRWLDARELAGLHRSVDVMRIRWRAHVEEADFIDDPIDTIRRGAIRSWAVKQLQRRARRGGKRVGGTYQVVELDRKVNRKTVEGALHLLRACLSDALEQGLIDANPAVGVKLPAAPTTTEPWTFLTLEEIERLLAPPLPALQRAAFTVAIYAGLRAGELWALTWDDVVLDGPRPEIVVRHSVTKRGKLGPTKGGRIRRVPLIRVVVDALEVWKKLCPATSIGIVFPGGVGGRQLRRRGDDAGWRDRHQYRRPEKLHRGWRRFIAADPTGDVRRVRFHDLRHTCASHLVMGTWGRGWRLEEVRELLGHRTIVTTQRYAHLAPEALHAAAAATPGPTVAPPPAPPSPDVAESQEGPLLRLIPHQNSFSAGGTPVLSGTSERLGPAWGRLRGRAGDLVADLDAGRPVTDVQARELAAEVLAADPLSAAAAEVLAEPTVTRLLRLTGLLLELVDDAATELDVAR